jgi:hypothetical protein
MPLEVPYLIPFRRENMAGSPPLLFPVPPIHLSDGQLCGQRRGILRAVLSELLPAVGNLIKPIISAQPDYPADKRQAATNPP